MANEYTSPRPPYPHVEGLDDAPAGDVGGGGYGRLLPRALSAYPDPERFDDKPTDATATGGLSRPDWDTPSGPDPLDPVEIPDEGGRLFNSLADLPMWCGGTLDKD